MRKMLTRDEALGLMDELLAEGFEVKLHARRLQDGTMTEEERLDARLWRGGIYYAVTVNTLLVKIADAVRVQTVADKFGMDAWLSSDEDGYPEIKLEMRFGHADH